MIKRFCLSILLLHTAVPYANDAYGDSDCPVVVPNFDDMLLLTKAERIQLMDQALKDALSQVQDCRQSLTDTQKQSSSDAAASSHSTHSGNTDGDGEAAEANNNTDAAENADTTEAQRGENQKQQTPTPSRGLSGTEASEESFSSDAADQSLPPQTTIPSSELSGTETPEPQTESGADESSTAQPLTPSTTEDTRKALENGKLPEDIPPANNDDIIAQQIREAAISESNPEKQAKLWNEYRRYKGIPAK